MNWILSSGKNYIPFSKSLKCQNFDSLYLMEAIYLGHKKVSAILGHLQLLQLQYNIPLCNLLLNPTEEKKDIKVQHKEEEEEEE